MISYLTAEAQEAAEPTLWQEIWDYIYGTYFSADSVYFENINFGSGSMITIRNILFGLFVGVIIASVAIIIDKRILGNFVRSLLGAECLSPESAKTLEELGFASKYAIRNGVRRGINLRSVVKCREEEEYDAQIAEQRKLYEERRKNEKNLPAFKEIPYAVNPDTDHFYIPEEKKYSADMRFEKKGTTWLWLAIIIAASVVVFALLLFVIPELLKLTDSFVGSFNTGSGNILT
ncbi:MAG: hypothetical protein IJ038_02365 [Clostridia bacterium]|nr:hypothetical protein [Clostridia bacterium]